ncbi:HAUS augmin-like complex subunit 8 [Haliotis cracherodii]|uniref:HAUS augmin-like complex subunit 8 n=1 Tax=Haliotis cracherodii TaxID=6455 RepID=UPI0039E9CF88
MSTSGIKRSLYRPAPKSNVGQNKNRRRLAQGRLVSGAGQPPQPTIRLPQGFEAPKQTERTLTPRKQAPRETESRSPRPSAPQDSLDLTDSEVDFPQLRKDKQVLVLDASRQTLSPHKAEVDVVMGFEKSPVRVVCHSVHSAQRQLRDAGSSQWEVEVDQVPHLSMTDDHPSHHHAISPRVVRETQIEGAQKDPMSASRVVFVEPSEDRVAGQSRVPHYPQPNFDDSHESDCSTRVVEPVTVVSETQLSDNDAPSVISESDACSLFEYVSSSKKGSSSFKTSAKRTPGKKKGGTVIPSRYMQSAAKASKSLSSERSFAVGKNVSHKSIEAPGSVKKRKPKSESRSRQVTTPVASTHAVASDKKTSTPTHDVTSMISHDIDASAIQAETSVISLADISHIKQDKKHQKQAANKKTEEVSQDQLDTLYARYLQWVFVEAKARMAFQSQEKEAMAQLSGLWGNNDKLAAQEAELKMELARLRHQNVLDDQLAVQEAGLETVVGGLDQMEREYNSLADSLDTTRHQIRTTGIYIPPDEDQFLDKLESALLESEQLLGELSVMTRQSTPHVSSFSNALLTGKTTLQAQKHQMKGCKEMLGACQSLVIQETSLKIQDIQINTAKNTGHTSVGS